MASLVIAAHGHLAEGLVASSAMIVGPSDDVVAVTFDPSEGPDDLLAKYAAAVEASSSQEYLILVDLFGGRSSGPSEGSKVTATTSSLGPTIIAEEATRPSARCPCAATTRQTMGGDLSHPGCRRRCVWPGQQQRV